MVRPVTAERSRDCLREGHSIVLQEHVVKISSGSMRWGTGNAIDRPKRLENDVITDEVTHARLLHLSCHGTRRAYTHAPSLRQADAALGVPSERWAARAGKPRPQPDGTGQAIPANATAPATRVM